MKNKLKKEKKDYLWRVLLTLFLGLVIGYFVYVGTRIV